MGSGLPLETVFPLELVFLSRPLPLPLLPLLPLLLLEIAQAVWQLFEW